MMDMLGKATEYFGIAVTNHNHAENATRDEQCQRLKTIEKAQRTSPEFIADYRKGDFQEKEPRSNRGSFKGFLFSNAQKG